MRSSTLVDAASLFDETWRRAAVILVVSASVLGCTSAGSVTFEGDEALEDLGTVGSALWVQRDWYEEDQRHTWHYFVASPEPGLCEASQEGFGAFEEITSDLDAAFSGQAQYDLWIDAYAALDEHLGSYYSEGSIVARMFVVRWDADEPTAGEQPVGGDQEAFFLIDRYHVDLFDAISDNFHVEDDSFRSDETCMFFPELCEGYSDAYTTSDGWVELSFRGSDTIRLEFGVELQEGWDGSAAGTLDGHIDARSCVLPPL